MGEEKEEKFEGTTLGADAGRTIDSDVDALIQGALKELDTHKKDKPAEKALSATHLSPPSHSAPPPSSSSPAASPPSSPKPMPAPTPSPISPDDAAYSKNAPKDIQVGDIVEGVVLKVDLTGALVDIKSKSDALLRKDDFSGTIKVGDKIKVMVERLESKEGYVVVSQNRAEEHLKWDHAFEAYRRRSVLEAVVKSAVKGGLLIDCKGIRGFIPASQVDKAPETPLEEFVGKTIMVKIIQVDPRQGKIVMSHRQAAGEKEKIDTQKIFEELEIGQVKKGRVSSIKSFGAFVNIGGVEGLLHLSELSWKRVKHPSEVLKVGDEIEVLILGVDRKNRKVSLGYKELQDDPWEKAAQTYKPGQIVKVKILRFVKFGTFVELPGNLEGLVHISEISQNKFENIEEVIKIGDTVDAKILRVIPEEQKIGLSIKQVGIDREKAAVNKEMEGLPSENKITIGDMMAEKEREKAEEDEGDTGE
ncbi:hypothetical protein A2276_01125 [candidate division WOR-1 bacterium RIFOXYA12_FULL_43_27]|uniref:S1 motif domain-containing protein n=1 Tax=candidate division WOR-1 bacterium RIFOXYC2_FULL_46_14 TaxID=1802587 RepID=A0A1F4U4Q4_UNCSA|nr:MAG: hypothetical protein A2276_01125 [candidate division WOR-1 bacterium RIFOXYA12_FULL_43_27]OGC20712.1 MAG: hypothetical protein A2292_06750 [candidate division WOR-1 bacterium RIFOXYB2_FULL_46_45]OGC31551.1 MAG: hypothetical protein A2232_04700 [candidate division WOR-1 bacterium RIFOXYA2_FULL_46_56]OGC39958.1 MAG: hypothetical protein A2438_05540 [candidate division WOR-1 bacterium RIFOXYC2_FULL_46_14]